MATTRVLSQKEQDIQMMLAAEVHLGTKNCDFQMERYVFKRRSDGIFIINLGRTWEKLQLAARVIVAIENPQDIIVQSARPYGQRAVLKFAQYTGAHAIAGRHTPGTFTNQLQTSFSEPRLLILTDPRTDHQPIKESALGNIPTIAFCDTDSPMRYVDIGIPANNKGKSSIGCLYWLLARMVLQMRGTIAPGHKWEVMEPSFTDHFVYIFGFCIARSSFGFCISSGSQAVDLFFYRDPEEAKEQEEEALMAPEHGGIADYTSVLPNDQWTADQWVVPDVGAVPPVVPAVPGVEWTATQAPPVAADGWDAAPAPAPAPPMEGVPPVVPSGWDASTPAPSGWDEA
ncbi:40S ribosomal protein SA [Cocos nucifera]|uniref:Small ribosomal subunit protein uS2 n=1 Tax=Cocos nucifera TaxID=13894 RepID=A0A8K0N1K3_COCNU|nr:40S ribosomal protein SA [Cocos nucifera]